MWLSPEEMVSLALLKNILYLEDFEGKFMLTAKTKMFFNFICLVFKILSIEEDCFVEKVNLRVGKHLNLNYSCNDVVWSTLDENVIATGATNGAVVLWNLSKITRAKQEHVFADHQRTVHKV